MIQLYLQVILLINICPYYDLFTRFLIYTYAENAIYNWVVAAVAHGKPVTTEENNVDVSISAKMNEY